MKKEELYELLRTTQDQDILWMYLLQNDFNYSHNISHNKNCTLEILKILSKDKSDFVKAAVASHPNCSLELLKQLRKDGSLYVIYFVEKKLNDK